jgi:triphosphoribosyl-dephospho-CoA synthase
MKNVKQIAQLAQMACIWEACAPKPGNVNRAHDFSDTTLEDFLLSAVAIAPAFENAARIGVGQTVLQAIIATRQWVRTNTNLGLILLLAPLVKTLSSLCEVSNAEASSKIDLMVIRQKLSVTLNSLTVEDARDSYAAIRLARPGGLGHVSQADVAEEPAITLLQAMALAQDRDAVASEYVTNYAVTFETGLPVLKDALSRDLDFSKAIVQTFLAILEHVPDTLIARKRGLDTARRVSQQAGYVLGMGGVYTPEGQAALAEMDQSLRDEAHTLNPGTTADLTAAAIFLALLK